MAIRIPERKTLQTPTKRKQEIPVEQIIAVKGRNPMAEGIQQLGAMVGQALQRRAQLRQQAAAQAQNQLAVEQAYGLPQGKLSGISDSDQALRVARDVSDLRSQGQGGKGLQFVGFSENTPIVFDPNSGQFRKGDIPGGSGLLTPRTSSNPIKAQRDIDVYTDTAAKALQAIGKIRRASDKLPNFGSGVINQAVGKTVMGIKSFAKDPNTAFYQGAVSQELIPLARSLAEEKGPITDTDVARIEKGLGDLTTPPETRKQLLNELVNKVELGIQNKAQTAGVPIQDIFSRNTALSDLLRQQKGFQLQPIDTQASQGNSWDSSKESRYQELLRKKRSLR